MGNIHIWVDFENLKLLFQDKEFEGWNEPIIEDCTHIDVNRDRVISFEKCGDGEIRFKCK